MLLGKLSGTGHNSARGVSISCALSSPTHRSAYGRGPQVKLHRLDQVVPKVQMACFGRDDLSEPYSVERLVTEVSHSVTKE
jgi:hypothetical protein